MGDTRHVGYPVPSETFDPREQGTDWPADSFTGMVVTHPVGIRGTVADGRNLRP